MSDLGISKCPEMKHPKDMTFQEWLDDPRKSRSPEPGNPYYIQVEAPVLVAPKGRKNTNQVTYRPKPSHAATENMKQPETQENNPERPPALAEARGFAWGDKCPDCGQPMDCDEGQRMTRQEPEIPPCVYCPDCGTEYPMTHNQ